MKTLSSRRGIGWAGLRYVTIESVLEAVKAVSGYGDSPLSQMGEKNVSPPSARTSTRWRILVGAQLSRSIRSQLVHH